MYLHSNYKVLNDLKKHKSKELELILIEIMDKEKTIIVGCIYERPGMSTEGFNYQVMSHILEKILFENK